MSIQFPFCVFSLLFIKSCTSFYIPGVAPVEYKNGSQIEVKAVKLTSMLTQLPYEYYSLPVCLPKNGTIVYKSENLGEVLRGDRITNTPYELHMNVDVNCKLLCNSAKRPINWGVAESKNVANKIKHQYYVHLLVDNLPVATPLLNKDTREESIELGFKLGKVVNNDIYINNHLNFILYYHPSPDGDTYRVTGFEVRPESIAKEELLFDGDRCSINRNDGEIPGQKVLAQGTTLFLSYSVEWRPSIIRWASRWDIYLNMKDVEIHWLSILNSVIVLLSLTGIVTIIIIRTLRRDIAKYNADESMEEALEQTGWKLVHGDIFRPPRYKKLFAAIIGSGVQIIGMALITLFFAMLGMLSPASRGALMTAAIFLYVSMGVIAGNYTIRIYKTLKGSDWKQTAFLTATLYPSIVFGTCFILNFFIWGKHSSGAVPFSTMLSLLCIWFGISVPLVLLGGYYGWKQSPFEHPVRTNQIPRQVPDQAWYLHPVISSLLAGVLPFGAIFIELFFLFSAIWKNQFYYLFGFLFLALFILAVVCSQISIVMVYFQLCGEDYHWWWRSVFVSGGSAFYVFLFAVHYFLTYLEITEFIPTILYFGYTLLMVFTYWLLTATIGFFACYAFVRKIYGAVKIE